MTLVYPKPDWEKIEAEYRAGSLSIRTIAERHGISDTAIRNHCKRHGINRDLTEQVRQSTNSKLNGTPVTLAGKDKTEAEIIEDAAEEAASIVMNHRKALRQWRTLSTKLHDALALIDVDEDNHSDYSKSLNAGIDATLKVIKGERQAYNMDAENKSEAGRSLADLMAEVDEE
jgi:hypothetical protein